MPPTSRRRFLSRLGLAAGGLLWPATTGAVEGDPARRRVLVELYTSQGCDMCPAAEQILGELAGSSPDVVPVAFHVDYFNKPWFDRFSDPLYSDRQATYNQIYTKPKPAEYGLYYTPMVMVDGQQSVNGRDPAAIRAAVRAAVKRPAAIGLEVDWKPGADRRSGTAAIRATPRDRPLGDRSLLICGVLREDGITTEVLAGENKGKSLVARFPARQTKYEVVRGGGPTAIDTKLDFRADPAWDLDRLRLAVFVQDQKTGAVLQSFDQPWAKPDRPKS